MRACTLCRARARADPGGGIAARAPSARLARRTIRAAGRGELTVRERLTTLLCALGALLVFVTLFARGGPVEMPRSAPPTTGERGEHGLLAARNWLELEGIRTVSLRERFDALERRPTLARSGNLWIVTTPAVNAFKTAELRALDRWVRVGNTLLVLAALSDRPAW